MRCHKGRNCRCHSSGPRTVRRRPPVGSGKECRRLPCCTCATRRRDRTRRNWRDLNRAESRCRSGSARTASHPRHNRAACNELCRACSTSHWRTSSRYRRRPHSRCSSPSRREDRCTCHSSTCAPSRTGRSVLSRRVARRRTRCRTRRSGRDQPACRRTLPRSGWLRDRTPPDPNRPLRWSRRRLRCSRRCQGSERRSRRGCWSRHRVTAHSLRHRRSIAR